MNPQQQKRARLEREYAKFGPEYLAANPMCEAAVSDNCRGFASMCHHRRLRKQTGAWSLPLNVIAVCAPCHDWIHVEHTAEAQDLGLLVTAGHPDYDACKQPRKAHL